MNLLNETIADIKESGHAIKDIVFIGSESGYKCSWKEFKILANKEYDDGYGAQKVATDLIILFSDGQNMTRREYDGSEWWEYSKPFKIPKEEKKIISLFARSIGWNDMEEINKDTK